MACKVDRDCCRQVRKYQPVGAGAPIDRVASKRCVAIACVDGVVTVASPDGVISSPTDDAVVAGLGRDFVGARS